MCGSVCAPGDMALAMKGKIVLAMKGKIVVTAVRTSLVYTLMSNDV